MDDIGLAYSVACCVPAFGLMLLAVTEFVLSDTFVKLTERHLERRREGD